jgi:hypothetical protein
MAAPRGIAQNPKGRPKGCRDKRLLYTDIKQLLIDKKFDPAAALVELAQNSKDESIRIKAMTELSRKYLPDLKAVEHKMDDNQLKSLIELKKKMLGVQERHINDF